MRTSNEFDNELVKGSSSADTIENSGQYATVQGGGGNDSILNEGDNSYIDGEAGNDTIEAVDNDYVTVNGGAGADQINGVYYNSSLNGGAGNDIVEVELAEVSTVEGGDGADEITGVFVGSEVDGGKGDDLITLQEGEENTSQENTVRGGAGNDIIINEVAANYDDEEEVPGNVYQYAQGDGNDLIRGITVNDTLNITSGSISNVEIDDEDNAILTIGTGKITLEGAAGKTIWLQKGNGDAKEFTLDGEEDDDDDESDYIELTNGNDTYSNLRDNVTIAALAGKDYVYNDAANVYIDGGAGNDTIKNDTVALEGEDISENRGDNVTIDGGAGDDSIISCGAEDVSISGGAGNDYIGGDLRSSNTINGGKGNDTIELTSHSGRIIEYENGDGKDIVTGYSEGDEIIIGTDNYTTSISGNDWIIKVGSGSITLKDAAAQTIIINGEEIEPADTLPAGWKYGTSSKTNTNTSVVTATLATGAEDLDLTQDYGSGVVSVDASKVTDGVQITGNDEGNSIKGSKGADTIITGTGDDTVSLGAGASIADVYVYQGGDDVITNYGEGKDTIQIIIDDMDNISMETLSNDVEIKTSAGTMTLKKASGKDIVLIDANGDTISIGGGIETIYGTAKVDNITNEKDTVVIDALAGNDKINNSGSNVTIIGGKGNDTITNSGDGTVYQYSSGDGKDVIQGFGENDTLFINASYSYSVSGSDVIFKVGSGSITLKNPETSAIHINDEVINIETLPEGWNYGNTAKTLFKATTASAESEIDLNENYGAGVVSVDGSKITGGVQITGNDSGNSIKGGKGADTIYGGEGNDTVSLGSGKDIYIYTGGDDVIADYKDGDDTIQIVGNANDQTVISSSVKGNDVILYTPNGNITVKNGNKAEQILVVNEDGDVIYGNDIVIPDGWKLDSNKKTLSATLKTAETNIDLNEDYGEGIEIVDANKVTSGVEIIANDLSNSVKGTKYDDVISGGEGDDTISLGGGADVYIYSGGDDVIQDFVAGTDSIQINTDDIEFNPEDVTTVGNDVVITTGKGALKVLKGKGKEITIMDADGEQIYPIIPEDPFPPTGWKLDSQKTKITASSTAEDLDLSIDNSVAAGVKNVDASKVTSGVAITGNDNENSIKGSKGDDVISGGGGNDTVSLGGGKDTYIYAGGDDVIQDYVAGADVIKFDTTNVTFDPDTGVSTIGSNVIIATGLGNITVTKGANKEIIIVDENDEQIYPTPDSLPAGWKYDSTHKQVKASATSTIEDLDLTSTYGNNVNVIDAASAKTGVNVIGNDASNSIRGSKYNDLIQGGSGNDTVSLGAGADTYVYTGGEDILQDYAAIDIIQITEDIQISEFKTEGTDFVIYADDGGILKVVKGATKVVTVVDADGNQIYPTPDTLPEGWKYDSSKTLVTASVTASPDDLDLTEAYGEGVIKVDASKVQTGAVIKGNDNDNSIKGGKGDDVIYGGSGNDTVSLGAGADVYVYSGGDDYIQDYATVDAIQIDSNVTFDAVSVNGSDVIYTVDNDGGTLRLKGAKGKNITFIDENGDTINPINTISSYPEGWKFDSKKATATVKTADAEIDLTEDYGDGIVIVDGSKITSGVEIKGNTLSNSIKGGAGADTVYGGSGNDTVSLGGGADVYVYTEGDDLIQDYKSGQDVIKFENEILSSSVSGTNVIITTDEGKVTVKGMKGKEIEVIDFDGETYTFTDVIDKNNTDTVPAGWKLDSSKKTLSATVATADVEVDLTKSYGATVTKVDGSKTKGGVEIIGNDLGDSIKGGSGADTIYGGAGNDTVSLGGGNDLFVYTGGNDLIQDYKAGQDAIQINTTDIDVIEKRDSGANVIVETSEGNITIKSGKGKEISFFDENGDELWFDDDGSFVSANTIDEITALTDDNYSQGKFDLASESDVLNPDEDYIAYCAKEENK